VWQKSGARGNGPVRQPNVPRLLRFRHDRCAAATIFNKFLNALAMHVEVGLIRYFNRFQAI
jgi:hypothetical protein